MQWWPVAYSWTYRDAVRPGEQRPEMRTATRPEAGTWLEHVRSTLDVPPVRRPCAARMAGSLSERVLRMQHDRGMWSWWIAVSQPIDDEGDFLVEVVRHHDFWLSQTTSDPAAQERTMPLHRLFAYD